MINYSISKQIKDELRDYFGSSVQLVKGQKQEGSVRYLRVKDEDGYTYNQAHTISLVDLFYNSRFENGVRDEQGERKMFMNISKFRSDVASKQIDIDTKDFRFIPDDYANPWTSFFLQKQFQEWAKKCYFGEILNQFVDDFPKYGTIVAKKVGKEVRKMPLQLLRNEQTAESLQTSSYVLEEHPDMYPWEIKGMKDWNIEGLDLRHDKPICVYERYGYVPRWWLKKYAQSVSSGDDNDYVDAMVMCSYDEQLRVVGGKKEHIFYAEEITERPYLEAHWSKQHGRWLGIGVMEDLISNQQAQNIVTNLQRRGLYWAAKKLFQTKNTINSAKNLVRDMKDGDIIDVGVNGNIMQIDTGSRVSVDFENFATKWGENSDQKAFTYEAATGASMPSGTPFRLGVLMSNAVNSFFELKREKLGLFLDRLVQQFLIPQFLREMGNKQTILAYFSDEPGFNALKKAAMDWVKSEAVRVSLLSGEAVDSLTIAEAIEPYEAVKTLFFDIPEGFYKEAKYKFTITTTGEQIDVAKKMETLTTIFQFLAQRGDPRAEQYMDRIAALAGENTSVYGDAPAPMPTQVPQQSQPPTQ